MNAIEAVKNALADLLSNDRTAADNELRKMIREREQLDEQIAELRVELRGMPSDEQLDGMTIDALVARCEYAGFPEQTEHLIEWAIAALDMLSNPAACAMSRIGAECAVSALVSLSKGGAR